MTIIGALCDAIATRWNHRVSARGVDARDKRIRVVSLVADDSSHTEALDQTHRLRDIRDLSPSQNPAQRIAQSIHRCVDLSTQSAARAPERLRPRFFWAPAACWCARTAVLSMSNASKSASVLIAAIMRSQTPFLPQREKRVYVACQLPNAGGRSRHGEPVRAIHNTASINRRLSFPVTPGSLALPGSKSLIRSHWSSRNRFLGTAAGLFEKTKMYQFSLNVYSS